MAQKEFNPDAPAAKGYETPTFDSLKPRHKKFVLNFVKTHCETTAAIAAGYSEKSAELWGFELGRDPDIVTALEEVASRRMNQSEFSRTAIIDRLKAEASVTFEDLCSEQEVMIGWEANPDDPDGPKIPKMGKKWRQKQAEEIEPHFRGCLSLISVSREGHAQFNTNAQKAARELLAKYMKWDQEVADMAPALMFDFSGLKD